MLDKIKKVKRKAENAHLF